MPLTILRKLRRFSELLACYRDPANVTLSLLEYTMLRRRPSAFCVSRKMLMLRLPNGLKALCPCSEAYVRAALATFGEIYVMRLYEKVADFIPGEHDVVLDLGAFIGLYTLKHHRAYRIVSVEPHPISYGSLKCNIEFNRLDNVDTFNLALCDRENVMPMYVDDALISSSTLVEEWRRDQHYGVVYVRTTTFDSMVDRGLVPSSIDIAKIDIEGAEHRFIKGARRSLEKGVIQRMVLEVHNVVDKKAFYRDLLHFGYKPIYTLRGEDVEITYVVLKR